MFTRLSNFTYGNYQISNIDTTAVNNDLALKIHIQKYEKQFLRMFLGECVYADLMLAVELDQQGYYKLKTGADEKWGFLINGRTYPATIFDNGCGCGCHASGCESHVWDGLVKTVATVGEVDIIETIMAPYIFFYWSLDHRTMNIGTGEAKGSSSGSTQATSKYKRIDAWNECVQAVAFGYPGGRVPLNLFLAEHQTEFPNAVCQCMDVMTYYDI